ncbi:AAA+ family ATPase [uncultured Maritimibacter sp.]|jgi:hypothetical protein|uniref:AAA+ family ATPase n=1 Tax=uncultured Maritimibacter sp. TaxID=991866 RepID=UPI002616E4FD|nr:AAA+ family ATPase [uncultured Maritimibacter sp.]
MKKIIVLVICVLMALPVIAKPAAAQADTESAETGREKIGEGFRMLLDGLADELGPLSEDVADAWRDMLDDIEDLNAYEAPERLPNGDIIIRRKVPLPEGEATEVPGEGTEL